MTDQEVIDNLMTFITAGHETTALGLAWTLHLLAKHPEYEAKVIEEIETVTCGQELQSEHIDRLAYTRQVFSEAMRLYPAAPIITRTAEQGFRLGQYDIPTGTILYVPIYAVHRHASLWLDAEFFDPDRFAPEATRSRHRYAYLPFGAGPRVCIGSMFAMMEAVAVLAVLLQRLSFKNVTQHTPEPTMKVTLRPGSSIEMRAHRSSRQMQPPIMTYRPRVGATVGRCPYVLFPSPSYISPLKADGQETTPELKWGKELLPTPYRP